MSDKPETVYKVLHESVMQSWAKDIVSVLAALGLSYANHAWVDGSTVLDVLACVSIATMGYSQIGGGHLTASCGAILSRGQREAAKGGDA